ncbi:hypothetical protein CROQUDRAFT_57765 [Cronartium quercuum f. sp. fusiforme G11]|uniref:VWFA domain-containing protein n=1 Tax=Cronartium quercuum f. sp. fusiforme G11 TaxID=708437 RepID=A0A9P6NSC1_9BASI|nr:hypothetical protein CROQUDRAFT_57765 [Cronartium quercuum f. sp. fusiforme G11]
MNSAPPPYSSSSGAYNDPSFNTAASYTGYTPNPVSTTSSSSSSVQNGERGLGGLIVGLGAAAMLNNALNNNQAQAAPLANGGTTSGNGREDPLAILARFDTILLIDDSASMASGDLWREAAGAVSGLAETLVRYDADGIEVYFLNSTEYLLNARSAQAVNELFQRVRPVGISTPTDVRVEELLGLYIDRLEATRAQNLPTLKPLNLIILTDGEADDPDTLAYALAGFAERLDQGRFPLTQVGVQFIQIGKDRAATKALQALDDELTKTYGVKRDIVDTTPYKGRVTAEFIMKSVLGAINKRIDKSC